MSPSGSSPVRLKILVVFSATLACAELVREGVSLTFRIEIVKFTKRVSSESVTVTVTE